MDAPTLSSGCWWSGLALGVGCVVWNLPGLTQVRWSLYAPEFRDPLIDKEYYRKPVVELTEEKYDQELKKTQLIRAAAATKTSSVLTDPVISKFTKVMMKGGNKVLARSLMARLWKQRQATIELNPYRIFHRALKHCEPGTGLVPIVKRGHFYQVPVPLSDRHWRFLAMKWMITECQENKPRRTLMPEKLSH